MNLLRTTLLTLLLALTGNAQADSPTAKLYVVHFLTGPAWLADKPFQEQAHAAEHSQNLRRLRESGALLIGARYADKGMIVLRADSDAQARAEIEADPAIGAGVFRYEIAEFRPFYGGCVGLASCPEQ